jgi:hypothetical protein
MPPFNGPLCNIINVGGGRASRSLDQLLGGAPVRAQTRVRANKPLYAKKMWRGVGLIMSKIWFLTPVTFEFIFRAYFEVCVSFGLEGFFMKNWSFAFVGGVVGIGVLAFSPAARADFAVTLTNCNSSFNCSPATGLNVGTVNVTNDGSNTVKITVTLNSPYGFHQTNGGSLNSFAFSLASGFGTGTISNLSSGWSTQFPPQNTDGMGTFNDGLKLSSNSPGPLVFDVTATGLNATLADFATGGAAFNSAGGYYFITDVICNAPNGGECNNGTSNGATGLVGGSAAQVPAPILGAGLPGLVAACAGLVAFARRRRNRFA